MADISAALRMLSDFWQFLGLPEFLLWLVLVGVPLLGLLLAVGRREST